MDFNSFSTHSSLLSSSSHSPSIFPPPPSSSSNFSTLSIPKEHMFDKIVTPSDVGKLNRLVIPKQHAQKYFPLERTTSGTWNVLHNDSSSSSDKGLLLNFEEDRTDGKTWRFRYSYWSSSQSYVITKGWSRFVKDKKLNSGDVISFYRAKDRLFIDWRYQIHHGQQYQQQHFYFNQQRYRSAPGPPLFSPNLYYFNQPSNIMAMDHNSFLGRPPLIVGGVAYEPDAVQGMNIMRSEAQQQRPHEIVMRNNVFMSTRRTADDDDEDEDEEGGETEEEAAAATHELLDSEAAPVHKGGEMMQLRLFGVNMKCGAPPPAGS